MDAFLLTPIGILLLTVAKTLAMLVPVLVSVAYLTLAERKVMAAMQMRRGPTWWVRSGCCSRSPTRSRC